MQQMGVLGRAARTFNSENLVANEYLAPSGTKVGDLALYIEYIYDSRGNILSEDKSIQTWTQAQEDVTETEVATVIDSSADEVSAKSQTSYSTDTTNSQYWLGLENDEQLTKSHTDNVSSVKKIIHYALPTAAVGDSCLERVYRLSSGEIVGEAVLVGTWTQAMQDVVAPPISDLTLSAATTVEDQLVDTLIGNLATAGDNAGHGTVTFSLTSTTLTGDKIRIDGSKLEVGPNVIGSSDAGTYDMVLRATDSLGAIREETHTLTITSNDITDIALSAATIPYGSDADTAIGTLSYTGGVGTLTPTITSDGGMTNLRLDGNVLEAGPSWMNTAAGTYTVRITATDQAPTPQTFYKDFTITVSSTAITDIALSAASVDYGDAADTAIGTLSFTGGVGTVTPTITNAGGMTNIRLDGNVLEVGPSWMNTTVGTHTVEITATDTRSQTRVESFTITVVSTAITDIALSATTVLDNAAAGTDIGNLTCTGGVGDVAYSITAAGGLDNVKVTDTGTSTAVFEVDTGGIVDSAGSFSVTFLATDTVGQTYSETISISVTASFTDLKFLNFDTKGDPGSGTQHEYIDMGVKADWDDSDSFWFRRTSDDYTISWWMRFPEGTGDWVTDSWPNDSWIISSCNTDYSNGFGIFVRGDDFKFFIGKDGSNSAVWTNSAVSSWRDGKWHHYAAVYDASAKVAAGGGSGTGLTLYRDSVALTPTFNNYGTWLDSDYEDNNTTHAVRFGFPQHQMQSHSNPIFGVNDIAIWKSNLSSSNVTTIYNSGVTTDVSELDASNLKRYYKFESGDGTDTAEKHTATIGSQAKVLEHYDNTKYFVTDGTLSDRSIEIEKIADSDATYEIIKETKDFTISFWIKSSHTATIPKYIWTTGMDGNVQCAVHTDNRIYLQTSTPWNATLYGSPSDILDDLWHHVVITYYKVATSGDSYSFDAHSTSETTPGFTMYLDGVKMAPYSFIPASTSTNDFEGTEEFHWLSNGTDVHGTSNHLQGDYDNFAIFNEHKTAAQILAMYNEGHGTNLANDTSCVSLLRADDMSNGAISNSGGIITNSSTATNANQYIAKWYDGTLTVTEF